jgi:hypothetical protein
MMTTIMMRAACGGNRRQPKGFHCPLQHPPLFRDCTRVSHAPAGGKLGVCVVCPLGLVGAALGRAGVLLGGRELLLLLLVGLGLRVGAFLIRYAAASRIVGIELATTTIATTTTAASSSSFTIIARLPLLLRAGALFFCGATLLRQCRSGLLDALPLLPLLPLRLGARCVGCVGGLTGLCRCGRAARALYCRSVFDVMLLLESAPGLV